jgi:hypothetical protein
LASGFSAGIGISRFSATLTGTPLIWKKHFKVVQKP